jgi:quinolinate synthase
MKYETPEITMNENLRLAALKPMERMMDISRKAGLLG